MRCNNCGYDNDTGVKVCIKCGHQLQGNDGGYVGNPYQGVYVPNNYGGAQGQSPKATVVGPYGGHEPSPKATVIGVAGMAGAPMASEVQPHPTRIANEFGHQSAQPSQVSSETRPCPTCGYPVLKEFSNCPSCGTAMNTPPPVVSKQPTEELLSPRDITLTCDHCGKEVPANFAFCPYCGEKIQAKTVFRRRHHIEPPKPKCSLTTIPEEDEQREAVSNKYEGTSVTLCRDNTEPSNRSITTKEQAELINEDGKWYILNRSGLYSTAVEANRKIEIQTGDVVVLGDRRFKFETE